MFLRIGDLVLNTDHIHSIKFTKDEAHVIVDNPGRNPFEPKGFYIKYETITLTGDDARDLKRYFQPEDLGYNVNTGELRSPVQGLGVVQSRPMVSTGKDGDGYEKFAWAESDAGSSSVDTAV